MSLSKRIVRGGALVSAVVFVLVNLAASTAQGQAYQEKVLYSFMGGADGAYPLAGLIHDPAGNLYGTTAGGGSSLVGTVFKISASGVESVLYSFTGGADGAYPLAGLIRDAAGNLYGTTEYGGASDVGTVFKVSASGVESVLYSFTGGTDGGFPYAGLIRDPAGNLYGTTYSRGDLSGCSGFGCGVVFKISASGVESVLYTFTGGADGSRPHAGLIRDAAGNLYGTTNLGGASSYGTVFEVTASGVESVLYSFTGGADGGYPEAGLIRDAAGNLYGTTSDGGDLSGCNGFGCGVVFKVSASGVESVLYSFTGGADGGGPDAGLIRNAAGNLYGTTEGGGRFNQGTVFRVSASGMESVLYSFTGRADGAYPLAGLIRDAAGDLYGTTYEGGASGYGTVFELVHSASAP